MAPSGVRRRRSAFAAGLATVAMALGLAAIPAEAAQPTAYVALGDSYAAGQGAAPYVDTCFRSEGSYPALADDPKPVRLVTNAACSGATTQDVLANQLGKLKKSTKLVTITVGANDLGTTEILLACLPAPTSLECGAALGAAQTKLENGTLAGGLAAIVAAVQAKAPNARIVFTGYPMLFEPAPLGTTQDSVNQMTTLLNAVIAGTVVPLGAEYVDVSTAFAGHGIGSNSPWINFNGFTPGPADFHPNAAGYVGGYYASLVAQGAFR